MIIKFEDFSIKVKNYIKDNLDSGGMFYTTDSEISVNEFPLLISYYEKIRKELGYFNQEINGEEFIGRFGQLIYEKCDSIYKLRLVFVNKTYDDNEQSSSNSRSVYSGDVDYSNIIKKVVKQNIILEKLQKALEQKDIFSKEELNDIFQIDDDLKIKGYRSLFSEVEDLEKHLYNTDSTLDQLKS